MSSCIHFTYYIFKVYSFQEYDKDISIQKNVLFRFKIRNNEQKSWVNEFQEKDQVFENKI